MASRQPSMTQPSASPDTVHGRSTNHTENTESIPPDELLELLGDEYTRKILAELTEQSRTCREIVEAADISRPTVYRRIERLQEAGFVDVNRRLHPDGHHCQQFSLVVEQLDFTFGEDGLNVTVKTRSETSSHRVFAGADD